jgi:hypothetical protein
MGGANYDLAGLKFYYFLEQMQFAGLKLLARQRGIGEFGQAIINKMTELIILKNSCITDDL